MRLVSRDGHDLPADYHWGNGAGEFQFRNTDFILGCYSIDGGADCFDGEETLTIVNKTYEAGEVV